MPFKELLARFIIVFLSGFASLTVFAETALKLSSFNQHPDAVSFPQDEVVRCLLKDTRSPIRIEYFPPRRALQQFAEKSYDGFFPYAGNPKIDFPDEDLLAIGPIGVRRWVLVRKQEVVLPHSLGSVFGSSEYKFLLNRLQRESQFSPKTEDDLVKGLLLKRVDQIFIDEQIFDNLTKEIPSSSFHKEHIRYQELLLLIRSTEIEKSKHKVQNRVFDCVKGGLKLDHEEKTQVFEKLQALYKGFAASSQGKEFMTQLASYQLSKEDALKKEQIWRSEFLNKNYKQVSDFLKSKESLLIKKKFLAVPYIREAFVFNHQGYNFANASISDDFDQSDEEKYLRSKRSKSFSLENIPEMSFDQSVGSFQVQVTIPLIQRGQHIGGLVIGVDVDKLLKENKRK